jgi:hypothetical protein
MITKLELENFRGVNNNYNFKAGNNYILGKNGAGKTTIKEAICFGLFGTDSHNSKRLQHLITTGKDKCSVTINDKHTRTLSGMAKIDSKLAEGSKLGMILETPKEALLAAFMPGYFMSATTETQHKLLDTLLPKVDRVELLSKLSGQDPKQFCEYNLDKRLDLVTSDVALVRRAVERNIAVLEGEQKALRNVPMPESDFPEDDVSPYLQLHEVSAMQWAEYQKAELEYRMSKVKRERSESFNAEVDKRLSELKTQIDGLSLVPVPEYKFLLTQIEDLKSQLQPNIPDPVKYPCVDTEYCHTCGQAVSHRHVEHVRAENARLEKEFQDKARAILQHNAEIQLKISEINKAHEKNKREFLKAKDHNDKISGMKNSLLREFNYLKHDALEDLPPVPVKPEGAFDTTEYMRLKEEHSKYLSEYAVYKEVLSRYEEAAVKISDIGDQIRGLKNRVIVLRKIEDALKQLPQEELKLRLVKFNIYADVIIGDEISVYLNNIPYKMLSTGQKMKIDLDICAAINKLLPIPLNMVFIDDFDLMDKVYYLDLCFNQVFICKVAEGELCVQ